MMAVLLLRRRNLEVATDGGVWEGSEVAWEKVAHELGGDRLVVIEWSILGY